MVNGEVIEVRIDKMEILGVEVHRISRDYTLVQREINGFRNEVLLKANRAGDLVVLDELAEALLADGVPAAREQSGDGYC